MDQHALRRAAVVHGIEAFATVEKVRVDPADQRVVAADAEQRVRAAPAAQDVVGVGAHKDVVELRAGGALDRVVGVALRVAALADARQQVDHDALARAAVVHRVVAAVALELVRAGAADEDIVAGQAEQRVVAGIAAQHVVQSIGDDLVGELRAGDVLDLAEPVARSVATTGSVEEQVDRDRRARIVVVRRVLAGAADQEVGTLAARELVVAAQAVEGIVAARADEGVGAGSAGLDSHRSVLSHLWRRSAWWPRGPVEPSSFKTQSRPHRAFCPEQGRNLGRGGIAPMPLTGCGGRVPSLDQRNLRASHVGMISAGGEFRFSCFDAPLQAPAEVSPAAARPQDSAAGSTAVLLLSVSCPPQALAPIPTPSPFS